MKLTYPARYWHADARPGHEDSIVCTCCPRECALREGQRGFCFTRMNRGGRLDLTGYGRVIGLCADPIEKKPLNHFYPGTGVLSFGTAGCNLGCKFCQNWSMSKAHDYDRASAYVPPERIPRLAIDAGCDSVAFTYNDPTIFVEYAIDVAQACREAGINTVAVTAGFINPPAREDLFEHIDAANIDLKAFTDVFYKRICLGGGLRDVLDTLEYLRYETSTWFEVTTLLIPDENDSDAEIQEECDWLLEHLGDQVPVHFTAFHPDWKMRDKSATPQVTLRRAREIALRAGLKFVYVGNVHDSESSSTYCPGCGDLLIERDWYQLGAYRLRDDRCDACGTSIPGVFAKSGLGAFGAQRFGVPV